jgi:hypothetical protein
MITLYTFGPAFGLPDPSPFVTKAEVLLKMAGVAYRTDSTGQISGRFRQGPVGGATRDRLGFRKDGGG